MSKLVHFALLVFLAWLIAPIAGCHCGEGQKSVIVNNTSGQVIYVRFEDFQDTTPIPPRSTVTIGGPYVGGSYFACEIVDGTGRRAKVLRRIELRDEELYSRIDGDTLSLEY